MKKVLIGVCATLGVIGVSFLSFCVGYLLAVDKYVDADECVPMHKLMLQR